MPVVPVAVQPTKKPPSRFFKSKSAPVVNNPAPLRPLEVTPNQPLQQPLPPAKGKFYNNLFRSTILNCMTTFVQSKLLCKANVLPQLSAHCDLRKI